MSSDNKNNGADQTLNDQAISSDGGEDNSQNAKPSTSAFPHNTQSGQQNSFHTDHFQPGKSQFKRWVQRLENSFHAYDVVDIEKRKSHLLVAIGTEAYDILAEKQHPDVPEKLTYAEIVAKLTKHYDPKPIALAEIFRFHKRKQEPGESVIDYLSALRKLSLNCQFRDVDESIRNQFVCGLSNDQLVGKFLTIKELPTLEETTQIAVGLELALRDKAEMKGPSSSQQGFDSFQIKKSEGKRTFDNSFQNQQQQGFKRKKFNIPKHLSGKCLRCGSADHLSKKCPKRYTAKCAKCEKVGHFSNVCMAGQTAEKATQKQVQVSASTSQEKSSTTSELIFEIGKVYAIAIKRVNSKAKIDPKFVVPISIGGTVFQMEIDTGADVSSMNYDEFAKKLEPVKIYEPDATLLAYGDKLLKTVGYCEMDIVCNNQKFSGKIYLVDEPVDAIAGRSWTNIIFPNWSKQVEEANRVKIQQIAIGSTQGTLKSKIIQNYATVFDDKIGEIKTFTGELLLRPDTKPIYFKPRIVPHAIKEYVEAELNRLEKLKIITKVSNSDWGTPIVTLIKNGNVARIVGDYKVTLNKFLVDDHYPIPRSEEIFSKLVGGTIFTTLDLHKAYLHVVMSPKSADIQTICTHQGMYRVNRMMFGVKTAPNIWQRYMDGLFKNMPGVAWFFDDIIIQGKDIQENYIRLCSVLDILKQNDLHLNVNKCKLFETTVEYLGYKLDKNGLHKNDKKVKAILETQPPQNVDRLREFLGVVTFYHKFIPELSTIADPFYKLLKKDTKYIWDEKCKEAFKKIKQEITSERVLIPYSPDLPLVLATDASPVGLAAILSHRIDNHERPIEFASRSLTKAEKNYSQIMKEATAIFWAFHKFFYYIYGRQFILVTDNKPLCSIFHPEKQLPPMTATRMLHYAQFLAGFNYKIEHRSSKQNGNVDYLSRSPLNMEVETFTSLPVTYDMLKINIDNMLITADKIQSATVTDPDLRPIYIALQTGSTLPELPFDESEISIENGCLYRGIRVIIPASLQPAVLNELHDAHIGIEKMKSLARQYCWWQGIEKDIELLVSKCYDCARVARCPNRAPIHHWMTPNTPWHRIHIDYAGPYKKLYFLICVDAYSKWLEVKIVNNTSTTKTIECLEDIFSRFGLPFRIVSDNGSCFTSKEFHEFLDKYKIKLKTTAVAHPSTNGQAERYVGIVKQKLAAMADNTNNSHELQLKLSRFLMISHKIISSATGKSPAELMLKRNIRTRIDILKSDYEIAQRDKITEKLPNLSKTRMIEIGSNVQTLDFRKNSTSKWAFGKVLSRDGLLNYSIQVGNEIWKRHIDQIRETGVSIDDKSEKDTENQITGNSVNTSLNTSETGTPLITNTTHANTSENTRRSTRERKKPNYFHDI